MLTIKQIVNRKKIKSEVKDLPCLYKDRWMSGLVSVTHHELLHKGHPRSTPLEQRRSQVY